LFFESIIWPEKRICPQCQCQKYYHLHGASVREGVYECARCKKHFTVTTKTPLHSTKLPLKKWLEAMYLLVNSSKGVSSVYLARLVGVTQATAWRLGHEIRSMMNTAIAEKLSGIVEVYEKYMGRTPQNVPGVENKRGRGTDKQ
jgi:transposase-like protein